MPYSHVTWSFTVFGMVTMQQYAQTDYSIRHVLRFDTSSTKILVPLLPNSRNNLVHVSTFSRKVKKNLFIYCEERKIVIAKIQIQYLNLTRICAWLELELVNFDHCSLSHVIIKHIYSWASNQITYTSSVTCSPMQHHQDSQPSSKPSRTYICAW